MTVEVWCKEGYDARARKRILPVLIWRGELVSVPRVGDNIVVFEGWAAEEVLSVDHRLYSGVSCLEIRADATGEYRQKAAELGLQND